ncbi:MAG: tRNA-binding protein [Patescibacteria group bacterium]|nr:tRNA-binding protein [Patescibacteria group bacterium]
MPGNLISFDDFAKVDVRVGRIVKVDDFPEARRAAYKLTIDFGPLGVKKSSARLTANYSKENLLNKQVACVVNFPPKQVGPFNSEVLVLGFTDENNEAVLVIPTKEVPLGNKLS